MRKHSENNPYKFMSSSDDSLSERQAILFSFKEIDFKEGITSDGADSHKIDNSSEMTITFFRDFVYVFEFTGLIDSRVNSCKGNKGHMRGEVVEIAYFSQESSPCCITDAINGSDNFHFLNNDGFTEFREDSSDFIELFHKMKESRDFLWEDEFFSEAIGRDRVFGGSDDIVSVDRDLSAFTAEFNRLCNNLSFRGNDEACGGELLKKHKHSSSKDITDGLQFREGTLKNPFNLIFSRSDKVGDGFSFSGNIPKVSDVLRNGELLNGILMNKKESGNSKGVFLIGLGFTQRQLCEIRDQKGIDDNGVNLFGGQERKEIDMIAACGFHACHDSREVFAVRSNGLHKFREAVFIHIGGHGKTDIAFVVNACSRKRIFRDIYTNEQIIHSNTSVKSYLDKAGGASRPILHDDKGSTKTQSIYYGYGRQGTDSFEGSLTQEKWSSPACPILTSKTRLYKSYNINP